MGIHVFAADVESILIGDKASVTANGRAMDEREPCVAS